MSLTKHCPSVSHLLLADDSLSICKATSQDCTSLARILQNYEDISGQKVNLAKSSIIFGMKIPHQKKKRIQNILGIRNIGGGRKYLGLPEQIGRNKTKLFQGVVNKVRNDIGGWYNQYLSPAGKEVLIKSVAQAKPVYSMSFF